MSGWTYYLKLESCGLHESLWWQRHINYFTLVATQRITSSPGGLVTALVPVWMPQLISCNHILLHWNAVPCNVGPDSVWTYLYLKVTTTSQYLNSPSFQNHGWDSQPQPAPGPDTSNRHPDCWTVLTVSVLLVYEISFRKIFIAIYPRLWLQGLYGLHGPHYSLWKRGCWTSSLTLSLLKALTWKSQVLREV